MDEGRAIVLEAAATIADAKHRAGYLAVPDHAYFVVRK
jgi:hypothetical protein